MSRRHKEKRLHNLDIAVAPVPGRKAADTLASYRDRYAKVIKATGMKVQSPGPAPSRRNVVFRNAAERRALAQRSVSPSS